VTEQTRPKRAALYLRVSTERQETENQKPALVRLAQTRGYEVVDVVDETMSATRERPALQRLMAAAHAGKLDVVVLWPSTGLADPWSTTSPRSSS